MGLDVGEEVLGAALGGLVSPKAVGLAVGDREGTPVGVLVDGVEVGVDEGTPVGVSDEGFAVGIAEGAGVRTALGAMLGTAVEGMEVLGTALGGLVSPKAVGDGEGTPVGVLVDGIAVLGETLLGIAVGVAV